MGLLLLSFLSGVLTVLAPCILPLLPIVVGGAAADVTDRLKPYVIIGSLSLSIVAFTLLLKASTLLITIPPAFWSYFSGGILVLMGVVFLVPALWYRLPGVRALNLGGNKLLGAGQGKGRVGDVITGVALGPVFSSCSPTYFLIIGAVLPASVALGLLYLFAYVLGLALVLLLITLLGQRVMGGLTWAADPKGPFKRVVGVLFLVIGVAIVLGFDKDLEVWVLDTVGFLPGTFEQNLLD
ncbi:cytochrome C biogenesis protein, partial [Patescibacteria group bacterium]|nr:cytochrome C biogenesis protein [Patescibacteria group bacterium]